MMTASVSRKVRLCSMRFSPTIRNCTRLIPPHRSNHSCSPCEPESRIETPGGIMRSHSSSVALCVCEHNPGWMCLPLCAALRVRQSVLPDYSAQLPRRSHHAICGCQPSRAEISADECHVLYRRPFFHWPLSVPELKVRRNVNANL
jgi:hypothetical protein